MLNTKISNDKPWEGLCDGEQYCPVCRTVVLACNIEEVESGEHEGYVFVHRNIIHNDDDLMALSVGIQ